MSKMISYQGELAPVVINVSLVTEDTLVSGENFTNNSYAYSDGELNLMKQVYGMRFMPYTVLCALCITFNFLSLCAIARIKGNRSVHHTLLMNLACCDIVGSLLLWMYFNSPMIFPRFNVTNFKHCLFIIMVLVAPFILSLSVSALALLSLALNQYIAICNPLLSATTITKRKACFVILICWTLAFTVAMTPALLLLVRTHFKDCSLDVQLFGESAMEICGYGLASLILIIVCLYGLIYREIVRYRRRTPTLSRTRTRDETENSYKAFVTTILLVGTLVIFWLPFMVYTFITAHIDVTQVSDMAFYIKMYCVDFLPMLNFLTDPIIYGIRMREIRDSYHRMFAKILPCCIKEPTRVNARTSIRFTSLDTTTL